ncbi:relaxase/mobilization nuclease domain-containing protein [Streptomyces sp. 5.8]|uniref:relaxase/mobilization nuclease domain-containing protein n=1 Tax=Streptomyces sp. 5.8 TaxID=3406571 RepID=UPI003BB48A63
MIANITKGKKAVGALIYDFGPGRRDEHLNPRIVAGNVTGTPLQVARAIDHTARQRPEIKAPIWRTSLSLPDEDGILPDGQWGRIAEDFIKGMGFAGAPWVAVRHGDDHIHLTVSRVDWAGSLLTDRWDFRRAREIADRLEQEHGLVRARDRFRPEGPEVRNNERQAAQRRGRGLDGAAPPEREELRRIVREVRDASRGLGREAFESGLADAGVSFRANVASTGRMNGYSFTLEGWTDPSDAQVWVPASKVARDLRWADLRPVIEAPTPKEPAPKVPEPRAVSVAAARLKSSTRLQSLTPKQVAAGAERAADILRRGQAERGIVPEPAQPAARTDPAAALLAQWRAIRAGEPVPAEAVPVPAPRTPFWADGIQRPYGKLSRNALAAEGQSKAADLRTLIREKAQAEAEITAGDSIATGQITGPHVQELHQRLDRLEKAEPHLTAAEKHMGRANAAKEAADEARKVWRQADTRKDMSRWELWRLGSNRATETQRVKDASGEVEQHVEVEAKALTAASKASQAARTETGLRDPAADLAQLRTDWPQLVGDAQQQDQVHGKARRFNGRQDVERLTGEIATVEKQIQVILQEQALRDAMPEEKTKVEDKARTAYARNTAAAPKAKKAGTSRRYTGAASEQPPHLRGKPPTRGGGPKRGGR